MFINDVNNLTKEEAFALIDSEMEGRDTKGIKNVIASLAIENMFLSQEFLYELIKIDRGENSSQLVLDNLKKKYRCAEND